MESRDYQFFHENEVKVTLNMVRILRWLILAFPAIMIFSAVGLFQSEISDLLVMTGIGLIVTMGPTIAYKAGVPSNVLKYIVLVALCTLLTITASNAAVGIYMTYALPIVFSIFYYDKKLTLQTSVFSYLFLVLSLFLRSKGVKQVEFDTNFTWFVSRSVGFLIENIIMALVCVKIAEGARKVLESLNNTQKVAVLVEECNQASTELRAETVSFKENIAEFRSTNEQITMAAEQTLLDCDGNEQLAMELNQETRTALANAEHIREQSNQMVGIAGDTSERMQELVASLREQTGHVVEQGKSQKTVSDNAENAFLRVEDVADRLVHIAGVDEQI